MSQFVFGSGVLWGTPTTDSAGNAIANPTPVQFGTLQDVSIDISFENKTLHGQNQFAVAVGRGKGKITGKAKFAQINGLLINSLFFGQTLTAGIINDVYDTAGAAVPATPFSITVTPPGSGTFVADLGVRDAGGLPMVRVASAPATGQYTVSALGVYLFAAADTGKTVFINYQYSASSTTAQKSTVQNVLMGYAPSFRVDLSTPFQGKTMVWTLPNAISTKLTIATKLDDFAMPEFDFEGFADSTGNVLTYAVTDR
jgi:hypothetical protein